MPASSRLTDLFGVGSPLCRHLPLLSATVEDGWQQIWANGMWGGYLTAEVDNSYARVRVDLYWPGIAYATVYRVHLDGNEYEVRGGDPATMCTGWARWDYEAPLDQAVYYRATSTERDGAEVVTAPVTVTSSTEAWLKHPSRPHLNQLVTIRSLNQRQRQARRGVLRPPLRKYPIVVHGAMSAHSGQVVLQAADETELAALNEMFDDGSELLLQLPADWGGHHWYVSIDRSGEDRLEPMLGELTMEHIGLVFEVTDRPPGEAEAGPTDSYDDVADAYYTYNHVAATGLTCLELSMLD